MALIKKITYGFVIQEYDDELEQFVSQEFVAGDQVEHEDEDGNPLRHFLCGNRIVIPVHSPSPVELARRRLDTKEAPEGFRAWLKYDVSGGENICRFCDYREKCLTVSGKCREDQRADQCSVFYMTEERFENPKKRFDLSEKN